MFFYDNNQSSFIAGGSEIKPILQLKSLANIYININQVKYIIVKLKQFMFNLAP